MKGKKRGGEEEREIRKSVVMDEGRTTTKGN